MPPSLKPAWAEHDRVAKAVPAAIRETLGAYFTPRETALRVVHEALGKSLQAQLPLILDPACGAGSLLLAAIEWASVQKPQWVAPWLAGKAVGWELDRNIAAAARNVLTVAGKCLGVAAKPKIEQRDALMSTDREIADVIVANPPWKSYSGRHAQDITPERRAWLARTYGAFAGWPASHTAFAELSARLIKRQQARIAILLPHQVADLQGYAPLRRSMANLVTVEQVVDLGEDAFAGVTEPCGLFVLSAGKGDISGAAWVARADTGIVEKGLLRHQPLPEASFGDIGVHTGNAADALIGTRPEPGALPIREGKDVQPFALDKPRLFLRKVQLNDGFYARIAPIQRFKDTRIVLRQTANRPIAAKHTPQAYFRNSVLACFGAPDHDDDYLIALFNSEYAARLHRNAFRDARQETFPQVKIEHLRRLPVPSRRAAGKIYDDIVKLSRALQAARGDNPALQAQLEALVTKAYGG
ncbi:MAG: N-6 DNA methylase [Planctomycetes bacterium]|nr:N-6 DNA methylase [Planctomycetota bacterium]